jgi:hypothetical protein
MAVWTTARGNPLDFTKRKYLVQVYQDQYPNIVYKKAAQMGLSERQLAESVWVCEQKGMNVLYTFPTQAHLQDFVQARLDPVLLNSDYLRDKIETADKTIQKIALKRIGKGHLYLRGSQNEKQIITIDADMIVLDERDRFLQSSVPFIDKRLLASDLKWRREISTPTLPGLGIDAAYNESNQMVWQIMCDECKTWQELDFFKNIDMEKCIVHCTQCGKKIDRLKDGRWEALNPESTVHGYKINGLYNPQRTVEELVKAYNDASYSGFADLQQFYNQVLGLAYDITGQQLNTSDLDRCKRNYLFPDNNARGCYAGVDVGVKYLHCVVFKKTESGVPRIVWAGTLNGFFGPIGTVEAIMKNFDVKILVIDKRPEVTKVNEVIEAFPNKVFAAEYSNAKFYGQEYIRWDEIKKEATLDRTVSIDYLISDIQGQRIELPVNIEQVEGFYDHLQSSVRVTEKQKNTGVDVAKWIEKGADHYLHALNYARIAAMRDVTGEALLKYYIEPEQQPRMDLLQWFRQRAKPIN